MKLFLYSLICGVTLAQDESTSPGVSVDSSYKTLMFSPAPVHHVSTPTNALLGKSTTLFVATHGRHGYYKGIPLSTGQIFEFINVDVTDESIVAVDNAESCYLATEPVSATFEVWDILGNAVDRRTDCLCAPITKKERYDGDVNAISNGFLHVVKDMNHMLYKPLAEALANKKIVERKVVGLRFDCNKEEDSSDESEQSSESSEESAQSGQFLQPTTDRYTVLRSTFTTVTTQDDKFADSPKDSEKRGYGKGVKTRTTNVNIYTSEPLPTTEEEALKLNPSEFIKHHQFYKVVGKDPRDELYYIVKNGGQVPQGAKLIVDMTEKKKIYDIYIDLIRGIAKSHENVAKIDQQMKGHMNTVAHHFRKLDRHLKSVFKHAFMG